MARFRTKLLFAACVLSVQVACGRVGFQSVEQTSDFDAAVDTMIDAVDQVDAMVGDAAQPALTANLVTQPGCEGSMSEWQVVSGDFWHCGSEIPVLEGSLHFFPGNHGAPELQQVIDLSIFATAIDQGTQAFHFEASLAGFDDPDTAQLLLEYLATDGTTVLDVWDSGVQDLGQTWVPVQDIRVPPSGTRMARIRMLCQRFGGSDCDGYWDAVSLKGIAN